MSQPPRRSRPPKPGQTIDSTAERLPAGPLPPQTDDAPGRDVPDEPAATTAAADEPAAATVAAAEDRPAPGAAPAEPERAPLTENLSVLGEPAEGDRNAPPAADGTVAEPTAADRERPAETTAPDASARPAEAAFAESESLRRDGPGDAPPPELDAETILAAAEPQPATPPRPELDYHATTPPSARGEGPGFGTLLGAAAIGAVLALLLGGALQYAGVLPSVGREDVAELTQQFARTGDVQQVSTDVGNLRNDLAQLQSTLSAGGAGNTGPTGAEFAALADRFTSLESRVNGLGAPAAGANAPAAPAFDPNVLNPVRDAAAQAQTAANEARDTANGARDAANGARDTANGAQDTANRAQTTADAARTQAADAQSAATSAQTSATGARDAATAAQGTADRAADAASKNATAIADIRTRLDAMNAATRQAAVAVSAAGLKAAVDRGGPFMRELETYATAAGASPAVESLRSFAPEGVATLAQLQGSWPDTRAAVLRSLHPADPNTGVGSQILTGLNALVAVRPSATAAAPGAATSPEDAAVARLDLAMNAGDLNRWLSEWQTLPQAAKDAGADFQRKVAARADVERVVGEALGNAVNSIGTSG